MGIAAKPKKGVEAAVSLKTKAVSATECQEAAAALARVAEDNEATAESRNWAAHYQDLLLHVPNEAKAREEAMMRMNSKMSGFS